MPFSSSAASSSAVPSGSVIAVFQQQPSGVERLAVVVATAGGVGLLPAAPGTFGAALGVAIFVLYSPLGLGALGVLGLGLLGLGIWAAEAAERSLGRKDDGRIVIDEVVGQLAALAPLLAVGEGGPRSALGLVTGFVAFRVFDVWKPGPVRWAERSFRGGIGVMLDDVFAGLLAAGVVAVCAALGAFPA